MTILISIISSVLTGIASSMLFWWWQTHLMRPKLIICPTIAQYKIAGDAESRYQVKIINKRRRPAINLNINIALVIPGLIRQGSSEIIALHKFERPFVETLVKYRIKPEDMISREYIPYFSPQIAEAIENHKIIDLKGLLASYLNSCIRVSVSAEDSFSGARCLVRAKYTIEQIATGRFLDGKRFENSGILQELEGDNDKPTPTELIPSLADHKNEIVGMCELLRRAARMHFPNR